MQYVLSSPYTKNKNKKLLRIQQNATYSLYAWTRQRLHAISGNGLFHSLSENQPWQDTLNTAVRSIKV